MHTKVPRVEEGTDLGVAESMRRDWDDRARKDAFYYIASWRENWDVGSFLASGEEDYQRLVAPVLSRCQFSPEGKAMVELGCGAGRMTRSFARRFERVYAFDVSTGMLSRAQSLLRESDNIVWIQGNGSDLSGLANGSVDFVFSYLVLQHLPTERLVRRYVAEMLRVLKDDGVFLFQFNSGRAPTMNWKGRLAWNLVDSLWALGLNRVSRATASCLGFDAAMAGKSWRGASVHPTSVRETVQAAGGAVREMTGENTAMTWYCGVKVSQKGR